MKNLFRAEVLAKQSDTNEGQVFIGVPLSFYAINGLIVIAFIGLALIACLGNYSRKERVSGMLMPDLGLVRIMPSQAGIIESIHVNMDDKVDTSTQLTKINVGTSLSAGKTVSNSLLVNIRNDLANLQRSLESLPKQYELEAVRLQKEKLSYTANIHATNEQITLQSRVLSLEKDILKGMRSLNAISKLELNAKEIDYAEALKNMSDLKKSQQQSTAQIEDIDLKLALLPIEQQEAERVLQQEISTLEQRMINVSANNSYSIYSPIAGRIGSLTARVGQNVTTDRAVMSILPENSKLQAELWVPTRAAGFINENLHVRLFYDAFPYQKFGVHAGTITQVSRSVVYNSDLLTGGDPTGDPGQAFFMVIVDLDHQALTIKNKRIPLQAGMTLSADIVLEERKIWEWVFEPIIGALL